MEDLGLVAELKLSLRARVLLLVTHLIPGGALLLKKQTSLWSQLVTEFL